MNAPESTQSTSTDPRTAVHGTDEPRSADSEALAPGAEEAGAQEHRTFEWWHHSHPTFAALAGFFAGMLFVTALPGGFAGILRLMFSYERAEELFPWVAVFLVVPIVLLAERKTRRFGQYMALGMVLTALVVAGVASLVLYFMVRADAA